MLVDVLTVTFPFPGYKFRKLFTLLLLPGSHSQQIWHIYLGGAGESVYLLLISSVYDIIYLILMCWKSQMELLTLKSSDNQETWFHLCAPQISIFFAAYFSKCTFLKVKGSYKITSQQKRLIKGKSFLEIWKFIKMLTRAYNWVLLYASPIHPHILISNNVILFTYACLDMANYVSLWNFRTKHFVCISFLLQTSTHLQIL